MGNKVSECVCTMHTAFSILATVRAHNYNQRVQRLWALLKCVRTIDNQSSKVMVVKVHNNMAKNIPA